MFVQYCDGMLFYFCFDCYCLLLFVFVVCCVIGVVYCLLFVVCCLGFIVCCVLCVAY